MKPHTDRRETNRRRTARVVMTSRLRSDPTVLRAAEHNATSLIRSLAGLAIRLRGLLPYVARAPLCRHAAKKMTRTMPRREFLRTTSAAAGALAYAAGVQAQTQSGTRRAAAEEIRIGSSRYVGGDYPIQALPPHEDRADRCVLEAEDRAPTRT